MSGQPRYPEPQRFPAVVIDRWGRVETALITDGVSFELNLRGYHFAGHGPDGLELVNLPEPALTAPDLHDNDLCSCTIEWTMPIRVAGLAEQAADVDLLARLTLGDPTAHRGIDRCEVTLSLFLPSGAVTTSTHGDMEDALIELQHRLPSGVRLTACISCAFSDYHPAGSGLMGTMACFRDVKDAYRQVSGKGDLFRIWKQLSGAVQETFYCSDYEERQPGAGYRGWPSFP